MNPVSSVGVMIPVSALGTPFSAAPSTLFNFSPVLPKATGLKTASDVRVKLTADLNLLASMSLDFGHSSAFFIAEQDDEHSLNGPFGVCATKSVPPGTLVGRFLTTPKNITSLINKTRPGREKFSNCQVLYEMIDGVPVQVVRTTKSIHKEVELLLSDWNPVNTPTSCVPPVIPKRVRIPTLARPAGSARPSGKRARQDVANPLDAATLANVAKMRDEDAAATEKAKARAVAMYATAVSNGYTKLRPGRMYVPSSLTIRSNMQLGRALVSQYPSLEDFDSATLNEKVRVDMITTGPLTGNCGTFATVPIRKGEWVGFYPGSVKVLPLDGAGEVSDRGMDESVAKCDTYLLEISRTEAGVTVADASMYINEMCIINSPSGLGTTPNIAFERLVGTTVMNCVALRNIQAGAQLFADYGDNFSLTASAVPKKNVSARMVEKSPRTPRANGGTRNPTLTEAVRFASLSSIVRRS